MYNSLTGTSFRADYFQRAQEGRMSANGAACSSAALDAGTLAIRSIGKESAQKTINEETTPDSMDNLPNEILSQILNCLDDPRTVPTGLLDEPSLDLTQSDIIPLKAASCVSKRWRQAASPLLFKHARYIVLEPVDHRTALDEQIEPFLDFARRTSLREILESFTLVVQDAKVLGSGRNPLDRFSSFWMTLFDALDPQELLIVAPAEALAALAACHVLLGEAWLFDCTCRKSRSLEQYSVFSSSIF